ncbi:MAG: hypothetical protein K2N58_02825 [Treponemataceae bacterium]|nr:hypothetical protein [Treponemataceae bacterium]
MAKQIVNEKWRGEANGFVAPFFVAEILCGLRMVVACLTLFYIGFISFI